MHVHTYITYAYVGLYVHVCVCVCVCVYGCMHVHTYIHNQMKTRIHTTHGAYIHQTLMHIKSRRHTVQYARAYTDWVREQKPVSCMPVSVCLNGQNQSCLRVFHDLNSRDAFHKKTHRSQQQGQTLTRSPICHDIMLIILWGHHISHNHHHTYMLQRGYTRFSHFLPRSTSLFSTR